MKFNHKCPKCEASSIVRIPGKKYGDNYNKVQVSFIKAVPVTRYLCSSCGYSEEWVDNPKDLDYLDKSFGNDKDYNEFV